MAINIVVYKNGESPLFDACQSGKKDLVEYLVEHKAEINTKNELGETPLFKACESGKKDIVEYLVDHGADINNKEKWSCETPLFKAVKSGKKRFNRIFN